MYLLILLPDFQRLQLHSKKAVMKLKKMMEYLVLLFKNLVKQMKPFLCSFEQGRQIQHLLPVRMYIDDDNLIGIFHIYYITVCNCHLAVTDYATSQSTVNFEAGSTAEQESEITVVPDDDFETNETYVVTLFIRRSVLNELNLVLLNGEVVVTILNDDSKSHLSYTTFMHTLLLNYIRMYLQMLQ